MGLPVDESTKVKNNTLRLVSLSDERCISVMESRHVFLVALSFALKLLGNFLLKDKGLKSIVSLLLGTRKTGSEPGSIMQLLIEEIAEATILAFVVLNLHLEFLNLLVELFCESLEFEELLPPALNFLDEVVVAFGDLGEFGIHAALEINEILPCLHSIARVLVAFADNFVEMAHRNFGHQWLLLRATEDSFQASIAAL